MEKGKGQMTYLTGKGDGYKTVKIPRLGNRPYLEKLLSFLEELVREEDGIRYPYEVCIDCREVLERGTGISKHKGHTLVIQNIDHSGVTEWIKCLKWMLEKK